MDFIYALLTGLIPSLIWLAFWTREDEHPEPRSLIAKLFFAGAIAVFIAFLGEKIIMTMRYDQNMQYILWAAVEEILKFIILITIALNAPTNSEPIDAMMYCVTIALGFAALENVLYTMGPFAQGNFISGVVAGNMRSIGASLVHVVSTACAGFMYGYVFYRGKFTKAVALILGLVAGIAIHSAFNIAISGGNSLDTLKSFGWIWGAVVIMLILFEEIKAVRPKEI